MGLLYRYKPGRSALTSSAVDRALTGLPLFRIDLLVLEGGMDHAAPRAARCNDYSCGAGGIWSWGRDSAPAAAIMTAKGAAIIVTGSHGASARCREERGRWSLGDRRRAGMGFVRGAGG